MPIELVIHLIERKKTLNAEKLDIDEKLAELPPEHLWVVDKDPSEYPRELTPQETKVKESFLALNSRKIAVQAQIDRAQRFGLRYTKSVIPTLCLDCFVYHDLSSKMVEIESMLGNGIRTFKCEKPCGYELPVDETISQPGSA